MWMQGRTAEPGSQEILTVVPLSLMDPRCSSGSRTQGKIFIFYSAVVISVGFRIVWIEMVMDQLLDHSKISVGTITIRRDTL